MNALRLIKLRYRHPFVRRRVLIRQSEATSCSFRGDWTIEESLVDSPCFISSDIDSDVGVSFAGEGGRLPSTSQFISSLFGRCQNVVFERICFSCSRFEIELTFNGHTF